MRFPSASLVRSGMAFAAFILAATCATAQSPEATADGQWHFVAGIYGWLPSISGSVGIRSFPEVPIAVPFSALWDHLKMTASGHFEGGKDRAGFALDILYVRLATPVSGQIPGLLNAEINLRETIAEGFGYYRLFQASGAYPLKLELLGGVRFWDINTRLESDITNGTGKTIDWADGFGGMRVELPLGSKLILIGRGDVGAGGAKLDWSASGDLAYRLGKGWITGAGYRTLNVDFDKAAAAGGERRLVDISMNGPRFWISYTW